jgi:hypothetical protein
VSSSGRQIDGLGALTVRRPPGDRPVLAADRASGALATDGVGGSSVGATPSFPVEKRVNSSSFSAPLPD